MASSFSSATFCRTRHAGLLLPLFSCVSTRGWGIGEIPDLELLARWLRTAGLDFVLVLPVNEMASGQHSPYSTLSAMALDPIYIRLADVLEFERIGGEASLGPSVRSLIDGLRASPRVDYGGVRSIKRTALRAAFDRFDQVHWEHHTARAAKLKAFIEREASWIHDYALFRAIRTRFAGSPWWTWPPPLAARDPVALADVSREMAREMRYVWYVQWIADEQWHRAREQAAPVAFFGDLPFMVGADSADVWADQASFDVTLTVGTPPDAFSTTGQDWGLPAYRWDVIARNDFAWLRARARRGKELYDGYRVDHVIGFYRTWVRPIDGPPESASFTPPDERDQIALGEQVMRIFLDSGACIIAEDLGTVPDFLRESLARLGVPGYKVLRWEREWHQPGQPFRDPRSWPALSVATSATHDTETLTEWWDDASPSERADVARIPALQEREVRAEEPFGPHVRDALLRALIESGSNLVVLPMQDLFGWRARVNTPATVSDDNWTWRLPWPVDTLKRQTEARERAKALKEWLTAAARGGRL